MSVQIQPSATQITGETRI